MTKNKLLPYLKKGRVEAGCDEAGRGCLAGPVFAAAVILPKNYKNELLDDSKKLSEKKRYELREMIERDALAFAVAMLDNNEIDKINILNASITGMHRAVDKLKKKPAYLLIDGNKFKPYKNIPHECIVKGDGKMMSIAAASILAKTYRDDFMIALHEEFPQYNWKKNKGYPTKDHVEAIMKHGYCKYHRKTFHLKSMQLSFEF
ncbi:MAG: ribonuclease HII [Bacteroidetes bacterium GWF2_38_335]|nr:MAG: ribonuclease HII [Bacteroidetes bacterium GWF2_38_335]OFY81177.1 MAG: ribonuclease HII [Bacteroidetes bacterium RIFOXYA12_FULL_38_20]HBS85290.1 ribonuclease HII [Bacteroidales bacterium]